MSHDGDRDDVPLRFLPAVCPRRKDAPAREGRREESAQRRSICSRHAGAQSVVGGVGGALRALAVRPEDNVRGARRLRSRRERSRYHGRGGGGGGGGEGTRRPGDVPVGARCVRTQGWHGSGACSIVGHVSRLRRAPDPSTPRSPLRDTSATSAELLRRTEEKREERVKERLDDYNKRNFKDYFDVVDKGYNGRQMTENDEAIRAQLKKWNGKE